MSQKFLRSLRSLRFPKFQTNQMSQKFLKNQMNLKFLRSPKDLEGQLPLEVQ